MGDVKDPKDIVTNINNISYEDRNKIAVRSRFDATRAYEARQFESKNDYRNCIVKRGEIFGEEFPKYG